MQLKYLKIEQKTRESIEGLNSNGSNFFWISGKLITMVSFRVDTRITNRYLIFEIVFNAAWAICFKFFFRYFDFYQ